MWSLSFWNTNLSTKVKQGSANIPSVSADIVMDFYKEYVCDLSVRVREIYEKTK